MLRRGEKEAVSGDARSTDLDEDTINAEVIDLLSITMDSFRFTLGTSNPSVPCKTVVEGPTVTWDSLGGPDKVKLEPQETVQRPVEHPSSRLFASTDFFENDVWIRDHGIGKAAKDVFALAIVFKFTVVALRDITHADTRLYVSTDVQNWAHAELPQSSSTLLKKNAYTIVESTPHSLAVNVVRGDTDGVAGTQWAMSIMSISTAYTVLASPMLLRTQIKLELRRHQVLARYDHLRQRQMEVPYLRTPGKQLRYEGHRELPTVYSLSHHRSQLGRVVSSPAPGYVTAVGSVGPALAPYEDSDTHLSSDTGLT
ncbi:uncharacterized protein SCHCODRAFT_01094947 [Schizophyllum commune H4-8]|nr:uncharacterized protein SCHCODRAFT_01094947 [Schizophyllum commune H4-8]KAI5891923.1 hypothetical protein SCHCODRAFT_01094947 [Schizophyllum commune H4-8]